MKPTLRRATLALAASGIALSLALTGCSPAPTSSPTTEPSGAETTAPPAAPRTLRVWAGSQTPIVANFNPFAPTVLHAALGPIYEPLFFYNKTGAEPPTGLLGDSFSYNEDGTVITVKLKSGITWNDGQPFTADDVVFTYGYEGNANAHFVKAEATDASTVVLTYDSPQFTNEFGILGATWMLPKHIWSEVADFTTFTNETPVGTGPYAVDRRTPPPPWWPTRSPAPPASPPSRPCSTSASTPTSRRRICWRPDSWTGPACSSRTRSR